METIDGLPPEARFLLRTLSAGLSLGEAAALVGLDEAEAAKRLRSAASRAGSPAPGAAAGTPALLDALRPLVERAVAPPARPPATACLADDVASSLAHARLAGPLLLASAEHAADCPSCLRRVLALRQEAHVDVAAAAPRRPRAAAAVLLVALVIAALLLLLVFA